MRNNLYSRLMCPVPFVSSIWGRYPNFCGMEHIQVHCECFQFSFGHVRQRANGVIRRHLWLLSDAIPPRWKVHGESVISISAHTSSSHVSTLVQKCSINRGGKATRPSISCPWLQITFRIEDISHNPSVN
jgi:hypothetical protein